MAWFYSARWPEIGPPYTSLPSWSVALHAPLRIQALLQPQVVALLRLLALLLLEAVFPFLGLAVQPVTPGLNLRAVTPKDRA